MPNNYKVIEPEDTFSSAEDDEDCDDFYNDDEYDSY